MLDWDDGNWPKCGKHGLTRAEIEAVFANDPVIFDDPEHSTSEQRFRAIGRTNEGRAVFVAFTVRESAGDRHYRPVSARFMHQKEVANYDKTKT